MGTIAILAGLLTSCTGGQLFDLDRLFLSFPGNPVSIEQVQRFRRVNSTVYLAGDIMERVPLIEAQVYRLRDSTGHVWVLTSDTALSVGDRVVIKGKVRLEPMSLAGQDQGEIYIEEVKQFASEESL